MVMFSSVTALAEETTSPKLDIVSEDTQALKELLSACDSALNESKNVIVLKDRESAYLERHINALEERNAKLENDKNSESNRAIWWFIGGMVVTGLTVHLVK